MSAHEATCRCDVFLTRVDDRIELRVNACDGGTSVRLTVETVTRLVAALQQRAAGLALGLGRPARFGGATVTIARHDAGEEPIYMVASGEVPLLFLDQGAAYGLLSQLERALTKRDRGVH